MIYFYKKFTLEQEITKLKLALCHLRIEELKLKRAGDNPLIASEENKSLALSKKKTEIVKKETEIIKLETALMTVKMKNTVANFALFIALCILLKIYF